MNIQSFYEYVILRDILAFILPGGITLAGIIIVAQAYGIERIEKSMPFLNNLSSFSSIILFLAMAFLIGHIWDMLYRKLFQKRKKYQKEDTYRKLLIGNKTSNPHSVNNHIANEIRKAAGEFLRIDWKKTTIDEWIDSGKAFEASVLLSYWIEEEDPKLFGTEIGRPQVQSHLLHAAGMAFMFLGVCFPLAAFLTIQGADALQSFDILTFLFLFVVTISFAILLINQGDHKREIFLEHVFRVFYVVWRKRTLENNPRSKPDYKVKRPKK